MRISDWSSDVCSSDLRPGRCTVRRPFAACAGERMLLRPNIVLGLAAACLAITAHSGGEAKKKKQPVVEKVGPIEPTAVDDEIGSASGRDRVVRDGEFWGCSVVLKKN